MHLLKWSLESVQITCSGIRQLCFCSFFPVVKWWSLLPMQITYLGIKHAVNVICKPSRLSINVLRKVYLFGMGNSLPPVPTNATTSSSSGSQQSNGSQQSRQSSNTSFCGEGPLPPECTMTVPEIIINSGYPVESHEIVTEDDYILTLHRIPYGRDYKSDAFSADSRKRPAVLLQHGVLADSTTWISNGPDNSFAFMLADQGMDVWLGNIRGGTYSQKHVTLDPYKSKQFWKFTWMDMAEKDLPAMVDHILDISGNRALYYFGHSQGNLIAFAGLASQSIPNEKIARFYAFAPVYQIKHLNGPLAKMTPLATNNLSKGIVSWFLAGSAILPKSKTSTMVIEMLCSHLPKDVNDGFKSGSMSVMKTLFGLHADHYYQDRLPVYFSHNPAGTSLLNLIHFSQMVQSGETRKFDHGSAQKNMLEYDEEVPPTYSIDQITTPISLYIGSEDWFTHQKDIDYLISQLNSVVHKQQFCAYDHLDFLWGTTAPDLLYNPIIEEIKKLETVSSTTSSMSESISTSDE